MASKHTPKPWRYLPSPPYVNGNIYGFGGEHVAQVWSGRARSQEVADKNGRLLAAAPKLLEACEIALANLKPTYASGHLVIKSLTAAIKEAAQ